jgi:hypothetical protein
MLGKGIVRPIETQEVVSFWSQIPNRLSGLFVSVPQVFPISQWQNFPDYLVLHLRLSE